MKKIILILFLLNSFVLASHPYPEKYYQKKWCKENKGIMEYRLYDDTRVDCLTNEYAIEFDFAPKWAESVGQSLYYAKLTGKKPGIVLILESNTDRRYLKRAKTLSDEYQIMLTTMEVPNKTEEVSEFDIFSIFEFIDGIIKKISSILKIFNLT